MESVFYFRDIRFRYYKVGFFNPSSRFTNVTPLLGDTFLKLDDNGVEREVGLHFPDIFDLTTADNFIKQIEELCKSTSIQHHDTEAAIVMELIKKLMLPLFGKVTLEKNKTYSASTQIEGLDSKHIGMGNAETWHGSPDFRIGSVCVLSGYGEDEDSIFDFDPRDPLTATCVVSSFINQNLNQRSRTPAILINGETFIVCLFDCLKDVLLISDPIRYVTYIENEGTLNKGNLNRFGLMALSIVIHHETTLLPPFDKIQYKSGIIGELDKCRHLQHFQDLHDMNIDASAIEMSTSELSSVGSRFVSRETMVKMCKEEKETRKRTYTDDNVHNLLAKKHKQRSLS